ncbi:hypothetical protein [Moorena bouillonii]|uniref:hypothetical protein n=1 Tax=Moorena bouillonii TaxID=207920 RepID=UPI00117EA438|nr:hypothetical protein [Moorena bouillonii]
MYLIAIINAIKPNTTRISSLLFPIPDSRFPIPDSRFPIPDSRFPIPDSLLPTPYSLSYHEQPTNNLSSWGKFT